MSPRLLTTLLAVGALTLVCPHSSDREADAIAPPGPVPERADPAPFDAARQLFTFERNEGQLAEGLAWAARGAPHGVAITDSGEPVLSVATRGGPRQLRPHFSELDAAQSEGLEPAHTISVYKGRQEDWKPALQTWRRVRVQGVRSGVDVDYYGSADGGLEYDFRVAPGTDPATIALTFEGADSTRIGEHGELVHQLGQDELRQLPPKAWTESEGEPEAVAVAWNQTADGRFGFELGAYDDSRTLVVDPEFLWATYFGGTVGETAYDLQLDGQGGAWLVGGSAANDLPEFDPVMADDLPGRDAFAAHFGSDGQITQGIWLGGEENEWATSIAVAADGSFWLIGMTNSPGPTDVQSWETDVVFPVTEGAQQDWSDQSLFASYFSPGGSLIASTLIGNSFGGLTSIARTEGDGALVVVGMVNGADVPDANDEDWMNDKPYFSLNVGTDGDLITSATSTATMNTEGGLAFAPDGDVLFHGQDILCTTFPDDWAPGSSPSGSMLGCLRKFSTFTLTESWQVSLGYAQITALAFDADDNILVTGVTADGSGFYITEGSDPGLAYDDVPFIAKLGPSGNPIFSKRWWPTGVPDAWPTAAAFDSEGNIYIAGAATEASLMVVNELYPYGGGDSDPFLVKLDPEAEDIFLSTFLGGSTGNAQYLWNESVNWLDVDSAGKIWVVSAGFSDDMPLSAGAEQMEALGGTDIWMAAIQSNDPPVGPPTVGVELSLWEELEDSDDPASLVTMELWLVNESADSIDRVAVSFVLSEPVETAAPALGDECAWDSVDGDGWGSIINCDFDVSIGAGDGDVWLLTVRAALRPYLDNRLGVDMFVDVLGDNGLTAEGTDGRTVELRQRVADLSVAVPTQSEDGEAHIYAVSWLNNGPEEAAGVEFYIAPEGVTSMTDGSCQQDYDYGFWVCETELAASGQGETYSFEVDEPAGLSVWVSARVRDPNPTNNLEVFGSTSPPSEVPPPTGCPGSGNSIGGGGGSTAHWAWMGALAALVLRRRRSGSTL